VAFDLDLALVMGSSEVRAAPSAAPPQPRLGKRPAGQQFKTDLIGSKSLVATLQSSTKANHF
jgi:hypothetical protein